jgi:hypothetical protein
VTFRTAQPNFSRGELSPDLYGRFDVDAYGAGVKQARNVVILKYGGFTKRPGTFYVDEVIDDTLPNRLVAFQFSLTQAYALEFGHEYMSPCADGGRVLDGLSPYVAVSPFAGADLNDVDFVQTADTMYFAHLLYAPRKLERIAHTDWQFSTVTFGPSLAAPTGLAVVSTVDNMDTENAGLNYFPQEQTYTVTAVDADDQESRYPGAESGTNDLTLKKNYNTITWDAVAGAVRYNVYKADNSQFFGYIGTTEELTFRDDNIGPALDQAPPQGFNPFEGSGNYPSSVMLFEQRSIWGRTNNVPNGIWGSRTAQLENMDKSRPLRADDSFAIAILSGRMDAVNQLVATDSLLALSQNGVFSVTGDGQGGPLDASSSPNARRKIGRGASRLDPLEIDNVVFYTPAVGSAVRTINYSFEIDGLKSNDVSIFSPHLFDGMTITSWCYAQEPRSLIWAARSDGALLCFTWEQEQNVWGWTVCETDGEVLSVCSISEGGEDRVYLIVQRGAKRFVERMASHRWDDVADCCFLDCAVTGEVETAQRTFSGLDHLEGREVVALADGAIVTGLTVAGGEITLPDSVPAARKVTVGLPYQVDVETLPIRINTRDQGWNVGRRQQIGDIVLSVRNTRSILAGIDADHLYYVKSRTDEAYASPDDLMNGDYLITTDNKAGDQAGVHVRQTAPLPFTLLGVSADPVING